MKAFSSSREQVYRRGWRLKNPSRALVIAAKKRATREGIPFDITHEDVPVPATCPVFGTPLTLDYHNNPDSYPSIDRLKPELGYVKGNVRIISRRANRLKADASLQEMLQLVSYMRKYLK